MNKLPPEGTERRRYPRKKATVNGVIRYGANGMIACTILELSGRGARLRAAVMDLPESFKLVLSPDGKVARDCKIVWQRGLKCGVRFNNGPRI